MNEMDINRITGLLQPRRQKLVRYYARMAEPERIGVHAEQDELMQRNREGWQHYQGSLPYCMLLKALDERYQLERIGTSRHADTDKLKKAEKLRVEKVKAKRGKARKGEKRDRIVMQLPLIKRLLDDDGLSWREIADYLAEHYQISAAHSHVASTYQKYSHILESPQGRQPALPGWQAETDSD